MNVFAIKKKYTRKLFSFLFCLFLPMLFLFPSCKKETDYFDYVSELRSNIFLAKTEDFSLRIYAVKKEVPYVADGIPRESDWRFEAYLVAPEGNQTTNLTFQMDARSFGGEMSYDNVRCEYYYTCSLDVSTLSVIDCKVMYGEKEVTLSAKSVKTEKTLSPKAALSALIAENSEQFTAMTDEYGFSGEIYLRLIYEDSPYYYVGIIDRNGKISAFLMNAETGKILARRENT